MLVIVRNPMVKQSAKLKSMVCTVGRHSIQTEEALHTRNISLGVCV